MHFKKMNVLFIVCNIIFFARIKLQYQFLILYNTGLKKSTGSLAKFGSAFLLVNCKVILFIITFGNGDADKLNRNEHHPNRWPSCNLM